MTIGRVVAASLLVGPIGALALTLGVVAGAPEHVITGAALLAFAGGWAMLAGLSARLTDQPQRWAVVPAVLAAATGLGLLVLRPGDAALTAAGWVWPPILLVLAAWIAVQVRRSLAGRSRWLLHPVVAVLVIAALGGICEDVALARDSAPPGQTYDVGGYRLHLSCAGSGGPTVVLQSGSGETSAAWSRIVPAVAATTRVCAYDRAGQGRSDDSPAVPDSRQVAADLHSLLAGAHETGPFVLVGHSVGGTYAMSYAARFPAEVAGLVLLDSSSPDQFTVLPAYPRFYAVFRRMVALLPGLARLGLGQAFGTSPRALRNQRDEVAAYPDAFRQAGELTSLDGPGELRGGKPLVVVTATEQMQAGWTIAQNRLAALSPNGSHRLAAATHAGLLEDPTDVAVSVSAIVDAVQSVRTGTRPGS